MCCGGLKAFTAENAENAEDLGWALLVSNVKPKSSAPCAPSAMNASSCLYFAAITSLACAASMRNGLRGAAPEGKVRGAWKIECAVL